MAQQIQQVAPVPNGSIPIMPAVHAGVQPTLVYQQPLAVAHNPGHPGGYGPRKPFARNPQEEQCKIFVGGVGKNTTEGSLRSYFGKFGEISDSVIMRDKQTGEPRGFAFVTFKSSESVHAVIEQCNGGGHTLDGKVYLQVRKYFPKAEYDAEKAHQAQAAGNPQYKGPMKVSPDLKVFVGGIGIGTTDEDVRKYFSTFGTVLAADMPLDYNTKQPRGFAFVGFETFDAVLAVTKDRYHQINGKTVEVKGADEQQAHLNRKRAEGKPVNILTTMGRGAGKMGGGPVHPGNIGTISGYGAYAANIGQQQQLVIPQLSTGLAGYAGVPAAGGGGGGGYVFDPNTNTYYQLPAATVMGGGLIGGGSVGSMGAAIASGNPYAGVTLVTGANGQQILTSPQLQRPGLVSAEMMSGLAAGTVAIGGTYPNETSTFGPTRAPHLLGAAQQQADPHVVYSTATSISAGDAAISTPRSFHPYGR